MCHVCNARRYGWKNSMVDPSYVFEWLASWRATSHPDAFLRRVQRAAKEQRSNLGDGKYLCEQDRWRYEMSVMLLENTAAELAALATKEA